MKEETKVIIPGTKLYGITQGELRRRILVFNSQIACDPYRDYNKLSPWSVIGSFGGWKKDVPMFKTDYFYGPHICKAIKLESGDELKFRCNHSWMINLGSDGNHIPGDFIRLSKNGQNIKIEESGLYDISLDPSARLVSIYPTRVHIDDIPEGLELWYNERNKIMSEAFRLRSLREHWLYFSKAFPEDYKLVVELPEVIDYDSNFAKYKERLSRDWQNLNKACINSGLKEPSAPAPIKSDACTSSVVDEWIKAGFIVHKNLEEWLKENMEFLRPIDKKKEIDKDKFKKAVEKFNTIASECLDPKTSNKKEVFYIKLTSNALRNLANLSGTKVDIITVA